MPNLKSLSRTTTAIVLTITQRDLIRRAALLRAMAGTAARVSASDIVRKALAAYTPMLEAKMAGFAVKSRAI